MTRIGTVPSALCLLTAASLFVGQRIEASPAGRLYGHVTDEAGRVLASARISVSGPGAVGLYETITDVSGLYQIPSLPTLEPLEVRAEYSGKIAVIYSGLEAREGFGTRRDFTLRPPGWKEVLVLTDPRVPYHALGLEGARAILPGSLTVVELSGDARQDERLVREVTPRRFNAVLAIGSAAADLARREVRDAPVVYTMVLDPDSEDLDRINLCGLTLNGAFADQLAMLAKLKPDARHLVTIYDPRRLAPAVSQLRRLAGERGMTLAARSARDAAQVIAALDSLRTEPSEAFFFLLDPDLFDAAGFERVRRFAEAGKMVFVVPDPSLVAVGGTFSYGPGFRELGAYAARLVLHLFSGADEPADIAVRFPTIRYLSLNPFEVERLGLSVPKTWSAPAAMGAASAASGGAQRR